MQSFVRPIARTSLFATGGSGAKPTALTTFERSKCSCSILCIAVSTTRAAICTPPAMLAVGATRKVSWLGASFALAGNPLRHRLVRKLATLEDEYAVFRSLGVADLAEQLLLHPCMRPEWSRPHGEEPLGRDGPAGIL